MLSTFWVPAMLRAVDPFAVGYSVEVLGPNLLTNSGCEAVPYYVNPSWNRVQGLTVLADGQLKITNTDTTVGAFASLTIGGDGVNFNSLTERIPGGYYKVSVRSVASENNEPTYPIMAARRNSVLITNIMAIQAGQTAIIYPFSTLNFFIRLAIMYAANPNSWTVDDITLNVVSNQLLHGVWRPPHATEAGLDAQGFALTNPA